MGQVEIGTVQISADRAHRGVVITLELAVLPQQRFVDAL
jgi:hypothetical protein